MRKAFNVLFVLLTISWCFGQSKKEFKRQGLSALSKGDFVTTKENYLKLLEKGEKTWETYTILGDCEFHLGNSEDAIAYYRKAQEKNPVYAGLYLRMGNVLRKQGKFEEAIINFRKMTITDPENPQIYNMISSSYYENGEFLAALEAIDMMVKFGGENLDSSYGRSLAYIKLSRIPEACIELEKADQLDKQNERRDIDVMKALHCVK